MTGGDYQCSAGTAPDSNSTLLRALLITGIVLLTSFNGAAQKNSDIGIFAGTSYYMGDLNTAVHYAMPSFAAGPIYRYNFNERNSLRAHAFYHGLNYDVGGYYGYNDALLSGDYHPKFVDLGLDFEFNWKPYKTAHRKTKASPYVFAGLGYNFSVFSDGNTNLLPHVTLPFGFGYKLNVGKWLSAGLEASARKAFSDKVDGITNPPVADVIAPFGNNDWYFFTGVFVTYKFFKFWEDCPTYD